jgi:hypothetical protein
MRSRWPESTTPTMVMLASRERSGAYLTRLLVVGGMFSSTFFLTQFLQGVLNFSAVEAGLAFLPETVVVFGAAQVAAKVAGRLGVTRLLIAGLVTELAGMVWVSRLSASPHASSHPAAGLDTTREAAQVLAHGVSAALTGATVFLGIALVAALVMTGRRRTEPAVADATEAPASSKGPAVSAAPSATGAPLPCRPPTSMHRSIPPWREAGEPSSARK